MIDLPMKFDNHWTYRSCYKPIDIKPSSGHLLVMVKLCVYQRVKILSGQHLAYQQVKALQQGRKNTENKLFNWTPYS